MTSGDIINSGAADARPDPRRYRRIAQEVRGLITSGAIAIGQPAPTIAELCGKHGCARQTAAKALRVLEEEGLLTRYPGFGYYATRPRPSGEK